MKKIAVTLVLIIMAGALLSAQVAGVIDFNAVDINGNKIKLSEYKDKVVVLDFWATWCPPCRREIPNLVDIKNTFKNKPFEIISIALERGSVEAAIEFVKEYKMNWVHIIDKEVGRKLADDYKIMYIPTMYVIKGGKIVATGLRGHELKSKLNQLLN
jgi:thiol-disulfide isomerase/thioredoxin